MLTISCKDLPNLDKKSKSDAFCVIWELKKNQKQKRGQTEVVLNSLDPEFVTSINVNFKFEEN